MSAESLGTVPKYSSVCSQRCNFFARIVRSSAYVRGVLLDHYMPTWDVEDCTEIFIDRDPVAVWADLRHRDMADDRLVRALFFLRQRPGPGTPARLRIDDIVGQGSGFRLLAEEPGTELVVGAIGKVWQPSIEFLDLSPSRFADFAEHDYGKVAWNVRVSPEARGTRVLIDVRVKLPDERTARKFRRYWRFIGPFSGLIRRRTLGRARRELEAARRMLPGDELIATPKGEIDHGIRIDAPVAAVWPWLVQMGCDRAGWYSWDRLDNGGTPSAEEILPSLQHPQVGDVFPMSPGDTRGFRVEHLDPEHALVLGNHLNLYTGEAVPTSSPSPTHFWRGTWAFVLEPLGDDATYLRTRVRADYHSWLVGVVAHLLAPPMHGFMQRKQLREIKRRAESVMAAAGAAQAV